MLNLVCRRDKHNEQSGANFKETLSKMDKKSNINDAVTFEILAAKGWSARKAALQVGVSPAHLARVCTGERIPSKDLVKRLKRLPHLPPIKAHKLARV